MVKQDTELREISKQMFAEMEHKMKESQPKKEDCLFYNLLISDKITEYRDDDDYGSMQRNNSLF